MIDKLICLDGFPYFEERFPACNLYAKLTPANIFIGHKHTGNADVVVFTTGKTVHYCHSITIKNMWIYAKVLCGYHKD